MSTDFFGRLHPLIVHLPIGIYILLFIIQYLSPKKIRENKDIITFMLVCGFFFASLSVVFGWLLSASGDYTEEAVFSHKWSAIVFAVAGGVLCFVHGWMKKTSLSNVLYHIVFSVTMLMLIITGHFGGSLTHGEDYLFSASTDRRGLGAVNTDSSDNQAMDPSSAYVFVSVVEPVLEAKCIQCHNEKKKKGGFRMDEFELLLKGGKNGKSIDPGNAANSELVKRMLLPLDDEKHMPPKGKRQLTENEVALIHWWINQGAQPDTKVQDYAGNDTLKVFLAASKPVISKDTLPVVSKPDTRVLMALKKAGFTVNPIAMESGLLHVSAINMAALTEDDLKLLAPVAHNIYWLELSDKNITDQALSYIVNCENIKRLDLKNTRVTGRISSDLLKLSGLEYLNLVGTDFDDKGLKEINSLLQLKQVYCWGTKVTPDGAKQFKSENTHTQIILGANQ